MWKGVQTLVKKYDVTWIQGRGKLDGAHKVRVQMAGDDGTPGAGGERVLNATDVILATGSRVKSLPGHRARRQADRDLGRRPEDGHDARQRDRDRRGRGRRRVRVDVPRPRLDGDACSSTCRRSCRSRTATSARSSSGASAGAGSRSSPTPASTPKSVKVEADGVKLTVGPEGKDATEIEAEILLVAAGRATNVEDVGPRDRRRPRSTAGIVKVDGHMRTKEPHLYAIGDIVGGLMLAHTAAHEGITAAHTIAGDPDVHAMDYDDAAAGHLLPARDRVGRPHRAAVRGAGPADQGRQGPVPGDRQGASSAASTRASPRSSATRRPRTRSASTSSARTRPTSSPRRRWPSTSTRRRGRSAPRRTRTRRSRRSWARPRWRSTDGRSTSSRTRGRRRRSATGPRRTR